MAVAIVKIKVGQLNTPIKIQRFTQDTDEHGFSKLTWDTIATPRCKVDFDDRLIREVLRDDGVDATTVKLFTMRYIPNITTKDRIFYNNTPYEIYSIQNIDEKNAYMRLWGRQVDPIS